MVSRDISQDIALHPQTELKKLMQIIIGLHMYIEAIIQKML
jgi:hypothetical protein